MKKAEMKKLAAERVNYPDYIAYIDMNSEGAKRSNNPVHYIPLKAHDPFSAMKEVEMIIEKKGEFIYLVDLLEQTEQFTNDGPIYKRQMRTRVNDNQASNWHFIDEKHGESFRDEVLVWLKNTNTIIDIK